MDISLPTIIAALLPVLATSLLCALMVSAAVFIGVRPPPGGRGPRK